MSEHEWFHDHLTLYSAGGLSADEASRLERHAAECAACAQEFAQWRLFDQGLDRLCTPVQFAADWDERVLTKWRVTHKPPRRWSSSVRWAAAAAAVVFIAVLGGAVNTVAQMGLVSFPGGNSVRGQASLPSILPVFKMDEEGESYFSPPRGRTESSNELKQIGLAKHSPNGRVDDLAALNVTHGGPADIQNSNSIDYFPPSLALITRAPNRVHTSVSGGVIGGKYTKIGGTTHHGANGAVTLPSGHYLKSLSDGETVATGAITKRLEGLQQLQYGEMKFGAGIGSEDGLIGSVVLHDKTMSTAIDLAEGSVRGLPGRPERVHDVRGYIINGPASSEISINKSPATPPAAQAPSNEADKSERKPDGEAKDLLATVKETHTGSLLFGAGVKPDSGSKLTGMVLKSTTEYYNLPGVATRGFISMDGSVRGLVPPAFVGSGAEALKEQRDSIKKLEKAISAQKQTVEKLPPADSPGTNISANTQPRVPEPIAVQQKPDPQVAQRKIIRTGDIEFEVDLFDNAVNQITKLIGAIPGAFVMTVNSDRLPNGKVKGSIVVRMPPEHLDKFVLDLRKDLAKTGELKSQRIGSQDVTKQYTDIESRLRAARAMEERLIKIIQNGKGDIKDLVAAERELGVWRTKIEESEGEIRYYNNQVGLSTLTIAAIEKEIRMAAAMVVTEQVTMKIEADDVEKSLQAALLAVTEAKGRVTKSDLKQHAAGQLEAVLQFEVAPAAAGPMKDKLKQLGIVTHQDSQRLQQAEGGAAPMGEPIKSRTNDVQFNVTLYNVANIKPREEFVRQIAVSDVAAEYQRLLELVLQTSGQVRVSQLDEKDKTNIFAQLDFDVPTSKRELFDKQLAAVGDVVARNTTQAGPGETATDKKVGYRLTLRSQIPPRETVALGLEVTEVERVAADLANLVRAAKGKVTVSQITQDAAGRAVAIQLFDVPLTAKDDLVKKFKLVGKTRAQKITQNLQAPEGKLATAHIDVTLTNLSPIVPADESLWGQIRTSLSYAFRLLSVSLMFVIVGVSVILPWALLLWVAVKLVRRARGKTQAIA